MLFKSRLTKPWRSSPRIAAAVLLAISCVRASIAQDSGKLGVISGTVMDAEYGSPIPNARVLVVGADAIASADMDGRFYVSGVSPGDHAIIVSAEYYKSTNVQGVAVVSGEVARVDVPLYSDDSDIIELEAYTVEAQALAGSSIALMSQRQKSASISDAIGSDSFSRLGIGDAADALSKTTGASIIDGKYVVIRGLSDRYNNTTLNGSTVPSADPDKRAVQLDQFPAGIIESIVTSKSFTPDKSGNFTGGSVNIVTKSVPDSFFMTVSAGFEYNENTTFGDFLSSEGGGRDWLGMDDGSRAIPDVVIEAGKVPTSPVGQTPERLALMDEIVKSFDPQMAPTFKTAPLNHSFSVAFGDRYPLGASADGPVLGVIGSVNYKRSFSGYDDGEVARYELVGRDLSLDAAQRFDETKGVDEAQWGAILNAAVALNEAHEVGVKTLYNQSGHSEAIFRAGEFPESAAQDTFQVRNLHYTERTLSSYQLFGRHRFEHLGGARVDWEASTSKSAQEEPDFRLFYDTVPEDENGRPSFTGNYPAPRRYWRELEETSDDYKIDFTIPIGERASEIKFGFNKVKTVRDFSERAFMYQDNVAIRYDGDADAFLDESHLGLNEAGRIQRYIREFVGLVPAYNGRQEVSAGYLMADIRPWERWRVIAGARHEEAEIEVQSFRSNGDPFEDDGELMNKDWLPAIQIVRELTENQNLRVAYSKTLARPNFRELSPFGSFDNVGGEVFIGNSELTRTQIENYDVRYEWFIDGSDLLAVSVFQKKLTDPIELTYFEGQLTYVNVSEGEVSGIELEARRSLPFFSGDTIDFSVGGNFSIIESTVDRSEVELENKLRRDPDVSETRELQGQSGAIGNVDVLWNHFKWGTGLSLVYNYTGERLYSVSRSALPDIYEEPSSSLDFIYTQDLPKGFSMKLSVKNILDDRKSKVWRDFEEDLVYSDSGAGRSISLSFSKRFD